MLADRLYHLMEPTLNEHENTQMPTQNTVEQLVCARSLAMKLSFIGKGKSSFSSKKKTFKIPKPENKIQMEKSARRQCDRRMLHTWFMYARVVVVHLFNLKKNRLSLSLSLSVTLF